MEQGSELYNSSISVHPCDKEEKGGCSQHCEKKGDEAVCGCEEGYALEEDEKTCEESKPPKQLRSIVSFVT